MSVFAPQLGEIVRRLRRQQGWTQAQLGRACGLRQDQVSQLENGCFDAPVPYDKLATVFHVPPSVLEPLAVLESERAGV